MAVINTTPGLPQLDPNFLQTLERMQDNVGKYSARLEKEKQDKLERSQRLEDVASYQKFAIGQEERAAGRRSKEATDSDKRRLVSELAQYGIKADPSMSYSDLAGLKRKHLEDVSESVLSAVDLEDQRTQEQIKTREKEMMDVFTSPKSGAHMLQALQEALDDPAIVKSLPTKDRDALYALVLNAKDGDKAKIQKALEDARKNIEDDSTFGIGSGGTKEAEYFWTKLSTGIKAAGDADTQIRLVNAMDDLKQLRTESSIIAKKRIEAYSTHGAYLSPERKKEMKAMFPVSKTETPGKQEVTPEIKQVLSNLGSQASQPLPKADFNMDALPTGAFPDVPPPTPANKPLMNSAQSQELIAMLNGRRPASRMIPTNPFAAPQLDPRFAAMNPRSNETPISIMDPAVTQSAAPVREEPSTPEEKIEIRKLAEQSGIDPVQGEAALRRGDRNAVLSFNMLLRQVRAMKSGTDTNLPPVGMPLTGLPSR